jgi:TldD protein
MNAPFSFFNSETFDERRVAHLAAEALHGADDGDLFLESRQFESFSWDDGKLKAATFDTEQGFGLRGIVGEFTTFAHAADLSENALRRASETIRAATRAAGSGAGSCEIVVIPKTTAAVPSLYHAENPLLGKSFEDKIKLLQSIEAYARARDPHVHQVSISMTAQWQTIYVLRADGWKASDVRPLVRLNVSIVVRRGDRLESGGSGRGGRYHYDTLFKPEHWQADVNEALRKALINLESVPAPAGEMTVVLGPGWPGVLLHEAIGHGLEGDFNRKKTSVFSGLLGEKIAAEGVTVVDDGTLRERRGSLTIDDEGTKTQRTTLIENGRLVGFMQDRMNARLMGGQSTGNGRRESYAARPMPRMTNTIMVSGKEAPADILSSVTKGIYAVDFGGGQVDITSGKFVFSASEAYEIEGGKIGRPLKGMTLIGTGFEALKKISHIGADSMLDSGIGTCGKDGQSVPVGVGQPTLRLEAMTVGGQSSAA